MAVIRAMIATTVKNELAAGDELCRTNIRIADNRKSTVDMITIMRVHELVHPHLFFSSTSVSTMTPSSPACVVPDTSAPFSSIETEGSTTGEYFWHVRMNT